MTLKEYLERKKEIYDKDGVAYANLIYEGVDINTNDAPIGNYARHDLISIIYGYSLGFYDLYKQYLKRVINWLDVGIDTKEEFGDFDFHQYQLSSYLAIAYWVHNNQNSVNLWCNAARWLDKSYDSSDYSQKMSKEDKEIFPLRLLHYIQAKEYDKAIQLYNNSKVGGEFKLSTKLNDYNLAYAYCLHFAEGKFSVDELEKAGKTFLKRHLKELYVRGNPVEMLYWLKTICDARKKEYTPEEVIYTFYEFIKEEDKPDFVKELLKHK